MDISPIFITFGISFYLLYYFGVFKITKSNGKNISWLKAFWIKENKYQDNLPTLIRMRNLSVFWITYGIFLWILYNLINIRHRYIDLISVVSFFIPIYVSFTGSIIKKKK